MHGFLFSSLIILYAFHGVLDCKKKLVKDNNISQDLLCVNMLGLIRHTLSAGTVLEGLISLVVTT